MYVTAFSAVKTNKGLRWYFDNYVLRSSETADAIANAGETSTGETSKDSKIMQRSLLARSPQASTRLASAANRTAQGQVPTDVLAILVRPVMLTETTRSC